ncbi:aspartate kinase [Salibacteraceae bacterium]|nr:aspartate kinase [Salibacteraceae bacterium]
MRVLKFGGTSVGSPESMRGVANILKNEAESLVVLSAISGTTNRLAEIAEYFRSNQEHLALKEIDVLEGEYKIFIDELIQDAVILKDLTAILDARFIDLKRAFVKLQPAELERSILAQGELMSTSIFHRYLKSIGVENHLLNALDVLRLKSDLEPDSEFLKSALSQEVNAKPGLKIIQGYICRNAFGEIDNLKRGGSDYSASLFGAALSAEEIQIWTDIDGMHNNDPRYVTGTKSIERLSFNEAAELAYFGAKILHPSSVHPAHVANIPVILKNTQRPEAKGTRIDMMGSGTGIKAIAAKDGITAIKVKSGRMLLAYGFLKKIFEVFDWYKTSIDMITTSEVAVSLTIDQNDQIEHIRADLEKIGSVEIDENQSIICLVGDELQELPGLAVNAFSALKEVNIRMISFGGSKHNISVLVDSKDKVKALQALHENLFQS